LGENKRNWKEMQYSIANVMNFNMFGIPMTGPTTCGYYEDSTIGFVE
jgi:alpha-glucosidase